MQMCQGAWRASFTRSIRTSPTSWSTCRSGEIRTRQPFLQVTDYRVLFERRYEFGPNLTVPNFSISADGREFLVIQSEPGGRHLNLVANWLQPAR